VCRRADEHHFHRRVDLDPRGDLLGRAMMRTDFKPGIAWGCYGGLGICMGSEHLRWCRRCRRGPSRGGGGGGGGAVGGVTLGGRQPRAVYTSCRASSSGSRLELPGDIHRLCCSIGARVRLAAQDRCRLLGLLPVAGGAGRSSLRPRLRRVGAGRCGRTRILSCSVCVHAVRQRFHVLSWERTCAHLGPVSRSE